jgi:hypothetical protein
MIITTGSYTENDYSMKSNITISGGGTDLDISGDITGKRIGDC